MDYDCGCINYTFVNNLSVRNNGARKDQTLSEEEEKSVQIFMNMAKEMATKGLDEARISFTDHIHDLEECYRKSNKLMGMYRIMTDMVHCNVGRVQTLFATSQDNEYVIARRRRELELLWTRFERIESDHIQSNATMQGLEIDRLELKAQIENGTAIVSDMYERCVSNYEEASF